MGVYGYDWPVGSDGKLSATPSAHLGEADALAHLPNAQSGYDTAVQAPWARYTDNGTSRVLWYEDKRSFDAKIDLVTGRGMAGFALWRLGQEDTRYLEHDLHPSHSRAHYFHAFVPNRRYSLPQGNRRPHLHAHPHSNTRSLQRRGPGSLKRHPGILPGNSAHPAWRLPLLLETYGGLPVYGYPITEEFIEKSPTDGKPYKVQYFERNRFEYHPENDPQQCATGPAGRTAYRVSAFAPATDFQPGADSFTSPRLATP